MSLDVKSSSVSLNHIPNQVQIIPNTPVINQNPHSIVANQPQRTTHQVFPFREINQNSTEPASYASPRSAYAYQGAQMANRQDLSNSYQSTNVKVTIPISPILNVFHIVIISLIII